MFKEFLMLISLSFSLISCAHLNWKFQCPEGETVRVDDHYKIVCPSRY